MFREANAIAANFTFPVVMSRKLVNGECRTSIGAFVVINNEGWIATAQHIVNSFTDLVNETKAVEAMQQAVSTVENDSSLTHKEKQRQLYKLKKPSPGMVEKCSIWFGIGDGLCQLTDVTAITPADFAVGKLDPFDPKWVSRYPTFKDPSRGFEPGAMLCKLGFPFPTVKTTWDSASGSFSLDLAGKLALFPLEGMFTRIAESAESTPEQPLRFVETSSPGLPGQSGGPTFDPKGTIWAVQIQTRCYPLGFEPNIPGKKDMTVHQFLNVGIGVHPSTVFTLFEHKGIRYATSDY